jgi:hypothetical protein
MAAALLVGSAVAMAGPRLKPGFVRGVHTEVSLIKADTSKDAFAVDRGQVTVVSQTSFTLERKDGVKVTLGLNANTKVRGDIQVGKGTIAYSRGGTAFAVLAPRGDKPSALRLGAGNLGQRLQRLVLRRPGLMGAVHADVKGIKADKSTFSFSLDRGDVTAASSSSVTLKRADGQSVTKSITADTKVRGKLAVGGKAAIISQGNTATKVLARAPKA